MSTFRLHSVNVDLMNTYTPIVYADLLAFLSRRRCQGVIGGIRDGMPSDRRCFHYFDIGPRPNAVQLMLDVARGC